MSLWLFGRKNRRKRSRVGSVSPAAAPSDPGAALPRSFTAPQDSAAVTASITASATGPHPSSSPIRRRPSERSRDRNISSASRHPNKLQKLHGRTYSFESGRADNLEMAWKNHQRTATADGTSGNTPHDYAVLRAPTLHHAQTQSKRDGHHLLSRTKSSKRRKNAHGREREAEIKAMSGVHPHSTNTSRRTATLDPLRPAVDPWMTGRPVAKTQTMPHPDSFVSRTARGEPKTASKKGKKRRDSDVSLPSTECIDSAMSSDSEQVSYVISPLAALAPKPTLRYAARPVPYRELASHQLPRKLTKPIPEATLRAHKRVDDLANDMNASDLRELMERDMRRRERKRVGDQERAARRLARQTDRQQRQLQQEQQEMRDAPPSRSSPDMARGVLGREAADLGVGSVATSAVVTSATRRDSATLPPLPQHEEQRTQMPSPPPDAHTADEDVEMAVATQSESNASATSSRRRSPVEMFYRPDSSPVESKEVLPMPSNTNDETLHNAEPSGDTDYAATAGGVPARTNSKLRQLAKLRKRLSNLSNSSTKSPAVSKASKSSGSGSTRGHARGAVSWSSLGGILRWASRSKRPNRSNSTRNVPGSSGALAGSSSLLEKAHHEMSPEERLAATAAATEAALSGPKNLTPFHSRPPLQPSTKPGVHRTMSRFREDLPEFLMSPPESRLQSPTHEPVPENDHQLDNEGDSMSEIVSVSPLPIQGAAATNTTFMRDSESDEESIIMPATTFHGHYHSVQPPVGESWLHVDADGSADPRIVDTEDHNEEDDVVGESLEPSPEPQQSLSLASIDSEGSWLSGGRAQRRRSTQPQPSLDSISRTSYQRWTSNDHINNHSNYYHSTQQSLSALPSSDIEAGRDDLGNEDTASELETINGEADTSGLTKTETEEQISTGNENESAHWGAVNQRKIQVDAPLHAATHVKSHEGLLNTFYDGEDDEASPVSPTSPESESSPVSDGDFEDIKGVQRATSVNLGRGHVRHVSAGSAKLLDISSPRNSFNGQT